MKNKNKISVTSFLVFIVMFCTYIFPLGLINSTYTISKAIFMTFVSIYYLCNLKKLKFFEVVFIAYIVVLSIMLKNFSYFLFISIPLADKIIEKKDIIINYLKNSNILYICLIFTLFYSALWFGENGRYAFSAIREINQSGLSIFCLGVLLLKKNKKIGIFTLVFGLFTFSRSYFLAIMLLLLSKTLPYKSLVNKKNIRFFSYLNITIVSSILFIILGYYYIYQYKLGNIVFSTYLSSKINLLDYSNFFRFTAILIIINYYIKNPIKLFTGISSHEYISYGNYYSRINAMPFRETVPHNLFFSHLKIYGIISLIETIYVSMIIRKIVNEKNFLVFIAIALYSVILGAGLYSYWLYLSIFTLLLHEDDDENIIDSNNIKIKEV